LTGLDDKTKRYALKLLSYKGRSEREMEERLRKKGASHETVVSTIEYLRNSGLLNDLSLAESLKREALTHRMLSLAGARNFILRRGIPKDIVDALFTSDEDTDFQNALRFADKKLRILEKYPAVTAKRRLCNLLLRRGYSVGTIMKVIKDKHLKEEDQ